MNDSKVSEIDLAQRGRAGAVTRRTGVEPGEEERHGYDLGRHGGHLGSQRLSGKSVSKWLVMLVPLASLAFTAIQTRDARKNAEAELSTKRAEIEAKQAEIDAQKAQHTIDWRFRALESVAAHRDIIFSPHTDEQEKVFKVIGTSFPSEISQSLLGSIESQATDNKTKEIINGQIKSIQKTSVTVRVVYLSSAKREDIANAVRALADAGFIVTSPRLAATGPDIPDMRFYHEGDKRSAETAGAIVAKVIGTAPRVNSRAGDAEAATNHPEGTLELWLR